MTVNQYVSYGYPSKAMVDELVRKRGFLRKADKKEPITNNVLIEELFTDFNNSSENPLATCICIEDLIDHISNAYKQDMVPVFNEIRKHLWPFQLGSKRETMDKANVKHEATGKEVKKRNTLVKKGGYVGFMGDKINEYVQPLI
jgi:large subunit ribosomal protein L7e